MPGHKPPDTSFCAFQALNTPLNCSSMFSGIKRTLPTIDVHCWIPPPFLTKYFELFNQKEMI